MVKRRTEEPGQSLIRRLKGGHLHEPPAGVLRRALALGGQLEGRRRPGLMGLLTLLFDSGAEPLPVGVRGAGAAERRLLYQFQSEGGEGGPWQLDLRVRRERGGTVEVIGQLLPPWADGTVEATMARRRRRELLGRDGEFVLRGLPSKTGSLRLEIRSEGRPPLVVGEVPLPAGPERAPRT